MPISWWYCRVTSSGVGPRNTYSSTMPPIALWGWGGVCRQQRTHRSRNKDLPASHTETPQAPDVHKHMVHLLARHGAVCAQVPCLVTEAWRRT